MLFGITTIIIMSLLPVIIIVESEKMRLPL